MDIHNECLGIQSHRHQNKTRTIEIRQQHCVFLVMSTFPSNFAYSSPPIMALGVVLSKGKAKVGISSPVGRTVQEQGTVFFPFA